MKTPRDERLALRLTSEEKQLLRRGAEIGLQGLSGFALRSALEAARAAVEGEERLTLASGDAARLLELVAAPLQPTPELLAAARARLAKLE